MRTAMLYCATSALLGCSFTMRSPRTIRRSESPSCSASTATPWADTVGAVVLGLPSFLGAVTVGGEVGGLVLIPSTMILGGYGVGAIHGFRSARECRLRLAEEQEQKQARKQALDEERARARAEAARARKARAWSMTLAAQAAARASDCRTVRRLDLEVWGTDEDFHAAVFVRDAAIARCLAGHPAARPGTPPAPRIPVGSPATGSVSD